jgi:hypothetical protein
MKKILNLSLLIFLLIPPRITASEDKQASELFSQAYAFYSQENHPKAEEAPSWMTTASIFSG